MADAETEHVKLGGFGQPGEPTRKEIVGSGISKTTRHVQEWNFYDEPELLNEMPAPWSENRAMIISQFGPVFARLTQCPGRQRPQCCHAQPGHHCFPNWRVREDAEWYAQMISTYLFQLDARLRDVTPVNAALAADDAFELGSLVAEAFIKFRWDKHAKWGANRDAGSRRGGENRKSIKRESPESNAAEIDALLVANMSKKAAYGLLAEKQGVTVQTISKEYKMTKKVR